MGLGAIIEYWSLVAREIDDDSDQSHFKSLVNEENSVKGDCSRSQGFPSENNKCKCLFFPILPVHFSSATRAISEQGCVEVLSVRGRFGPE